MRAMPRRQREHEREAWDLLTTRAVWASRISALRIEGGGLGTGQLEMLLSKNHWCRELWLCKCPGVDGKLWNFLGNEWEGRTALEVLSVMKCGGQLDQAVLEMIGELKGMQVRFSHPLP